MSFFTEVNYLPEYFEADLVSTADDWRRRPGAGQFAGFEADVRSHLQRYSRKLRELQRQAGRPAGLALLDNAEAQIWQMADDAIRTAGQIGIVEHA